MVSKSLDPDQALQNVGPDLGPNCLHRLSADHTSRQRVEMSKGFVNNLVQNKWKSDIFMFQSPGLGEKGSAIDLGLGPAIDEHAARNYRTIKAVSTFFC